MLASGAMTSTCGVIISSRCIALLLPLPDRGVLGASPRVYAFLTSHLSAAVSAEVPQEAGRALARYTTGTLSGRRQASYHLSSMVGGSDDNRGPQSHRCRHRQRPCGSPGTGTSRAPPVPEGRPSQSER